MSATLKYSLLLILWLSVQTASASGIQVFPARLNFILPAGQTASVQITVANPSAGVQTFQIYAEDFPSKISAQPNDFSLEPGGRKTVTVSVNAAGLPANISTRVDIIARPLNGNKLSIAAGVKIPLSVKQNGAGLNWPAKTNWPAYLAALAIATGLLWLNNLKSAKKAA